MPEKTTPQTEDKNLQLTRDTARHLRPPVDIYENAHGLRLLADLPGVEAKDLNVRVENGVLTVAATPHLELPGQPVHEEFALSSYFRQFELSDSVDTTKIKASLKHGVLVLDLPRSARTTPREVEVRLG